MVTSALRRLACVGAVMTLAAALAIAGCGSSEDGAQSTASATATPTVGEQEDVLGRFPEVPEASGSTRPPTSAEGSGASTFLAAVFEDVQAMWRHEFEAAGVTYTPATMTVFHDAVDTACGTQGSDVGPFYCPADHGVYLDTRFFASLARRAGTRLGDFAQAFVISHEVAHHVQTLLGILPRVRAEDEQDPVGQNARSVRVELQADCLAGVWKHSAYWRGALTRADFEDALRAAAAVGNDFQQKLATGTIIPEDWTHGSSSQRQHWLTTGFEQGTPAACDTFAA